MRLPSWLQPRRHDRAGEDARRHVLQEEAHRALLEAFEAEVRVAPPRGGGDLDEIHRVCGCGGLLHMIDRPVVVAIVGRKWDRIHAHCWHEARP